MALSGKTRLRDLDPALDGLDPASEQGVLSLLEDRDKVIRLQQQQLERLGAELSRVKAERDLLLTRLALANADNGNENEEAGDDSTFDIGGGEDDEDDNNDDDHAVDLDIAEDAKHVTGLKPYPVSASPSATKSRAGGSGGDTRLRNRSHVSGTDVPLSPRSSSSGGKTLVRESSTGGSSGSGSRVQRQRSLKNSSDEALKRSRPHQAGYQLSQDLHDKQVEMLERKYGGSIRSRRAARTIQRAYRQYCMTRNFQKLRHSCNERRLSKRLSELGRSTSVWQAGGNNSGSLDNILAHNNNNQRNSRSDVISSSNDDADNNNDGRGGEAHSRNSRGMGPTYETNTSNNNYHQQYRQQRVPSGHGSLDREILPNQRQPPPPPQRVDSVRRSEQVHHHHFHHHNPHGLSRNAFSTPGFSQDASMYSSSKSHPSQPHGRSKSANLSSTYSNGHDYHAAPAARGVSLYSDTATPVSGAGDFIRTPPPDVAGTPAGAGLDPHSMDFETLLESKETDILTDSFHSSEGHDTSTGSGISYQQQHAHRLSQQHVSTRPSLSSVSSEGHSTGSATSRASLDSARTISIDPSDYLPAESEGAGTTSLDISDEGGNPDSPVYTREQMTAAQMRYYMTNSQTKSRLPRQQQSQPQQHLTQHQQQQLHSSPKVAVVAPSTRSTDQSPIWKRKGDGSMATSSSSSPPTGTSTTAKPGPGPAAVTDPVDPKKRMSNISETSEGESLDGNSCLTATSSSDNETAGGTATSSAENVSTLSGLGVSNTTLHSGLSNSSGTLSIGASPGSALGGSDGSLSYQRKLRMSMTNPDTSSSSGGGAHTSQTVPRVNDKKRKRLYRIGLNLFNKKPEKGLDFLLDNMFLECSPRHVARFLITRKGLSKQMIGEFLGNLQNPFNQEVLQYFCEEIDLSGLQVDLALRKFQCHFRMPGEAQKIERLMEAFADRYCECNPDQVKNFKSSDTVFLLAFAIIMLNTDLHNPSVKAERKMKLEDFVKNMRGIDDGGDIDRDLLAGIYERVKGQEFKAGTDQVTQVMKVEQTIIGKKPSLALSHRRLVCYCRLYEVHDPNKKEKLGLHQREVFLFNDLLLVTKIFSKKKTGITYSFRNSLSLCGMQVYLFETPHYQFGIQLTNTIDGKALITFNARNDHDRQKFVEDLKESILETNGMEQLRIEEEMSRHRGGTHHHHHTLDKRYANDDATNHRVLAYDLAKPAANGSNNGGSGTGGGSGGVATSSGAVDTNRLSAPDCSGGLKKVAYSNSLSDLSTDPVMKRGSSGASLDSGMASGSLGSTSSDSHPSGSSGLAPGAAQAGGRSSAASAASSKRQSAQATQQRGGNPIVLKPGLPDGTQV